MEFWELNIIILIDFDSKWKDMILEGIVIFILVVIENVDLYIKVGVYEGVGYI